MLERFSDTFHPGLVHLFVECARAGVIQYRENGVRLASGEISHVYVDTNMLSEHPWLLAEFGAVLAKVVREIVSQIDLKGRTPCIIGVPESGNMLAQEAVMSRVRGCSQQEDLIPVFRRMRARRKSDGRGGLIAPPERRHFYVLLENVVTSGRTTLQCLQKLKEEGFDVEDIHIVVLIDRGQGGVARLVDAGHKTTVVFLLTEVLILLGQQRVWSQKKVRAALNELLHKQH